MKKFLPEFPPVPKPLPLPPPDTPAAPARPAEVTPAAIADARDLWHRHAPAGWGSLIDAPEYRAP